MRNMTARALILAAAAFALTAQERSIQRDASALPWKPIPLAAIPKGLEQKALYDDAAGKSSAAIIRYPKGYREPRHYHITCTHTIYILKGRLKTPEGELRPGTFLFSAKNDRHGPITALEETEILFHTNGPFDFHLDDSPKTK